MMHFIHHAIHVLDAPDSRWRDSQWRKHNAA